MSMVRISAARARPGDSKEADLRDLELDLRADVEGEVRFSAGDRALYATDASNYRQVPIGVVIPRTAGDVVAAAAVARRHGVPLLARGAGTSLAGQCCNVAIVLDFSKYLNRLVSFDPFEKLTRVQPGMVLDNLREEAAKWHLTFGPDPATHRDCTIGGMIGNNACGVHSLMAGKTEDNVEELDIITYDGVRMTVGRTGEDELNRIVAEGGRRGEIYARLKAIRDRYGDEVRGRYPAIPRRVSGYNLDQLLPENGFHVARALVGSESTCAIVLEAKLRLIDSPPKSSLLALGYPDVFAAADCVPRILQFRPIGLEGLDEILLDEMKRTGISTDAANLLPAGKGWLLVEFGGDTKQECARKARTLMTALAEDAAAPAMKLLDHRNDEALLWRMIESALGATAFVPGRPAAWPGWEDSAVAPDRVGPYLRDLRKLYDKFHYRGALYGHFGQGCIHTRIDFDFRSAEGVRRYRRFTEEATDLVIRHGGVYSGEHGDGQAKAEFLQKLYGEEIVHAFREFKAAWDPGGKMNPGKIVDPYRIDENLRVGADYRPGRPATYFHFTRDGGDPAAATERCVGIGECRREHGGVMCPSYRVTREERHSTRGRAHLLFEMLSGQTIHEGWRSEAVKDALDLCLACKGCKGECPASVDIATYKAEFLAHYYKGRIRPPGAYSVGLIYWWARLASLAPRLANLVIQRGRTGEAIKSVAGIAPERRLPRFAGRTFKSWFAARPKRNIGRPPVMLWPDTFNNYFYPRIAVAAVEVLEDAGFQVIVPRQPLCCGRPLYDFGMLGAAKRMLRDILSALRPAIEAGTPIVGLEPSCVSVFRDELPDLFPSRRNARQLASQVFTLAEFLDSHAPDYDVPTLRRRVIVHGHCHQKAVLSMSAEQKLYARAGLNYRLLDSGCCGMAGSFGLEREHYAISMQIGEQGVFPQVRQAASDTLIAADGFSCREQIEHGAGRRPLHTAELLRLAIQERGGARTMEERVPVDPRLLVATGAAGLLIGGGLLWGLQHRRSKRNENH
jgi:FAD/FMN-containing dehydrogenase/Fe-S oxidoreductase